MPSSWCLWLLKFRIHSDLGMEMAMLENRKVRKLFLQNVEKSILENCNVFSSATAHQAMLKLCTTHFSQTKHELEFIISGWSGLACSHSQGHVWIHPNQLSTRDPSTFLGKSITQGGGGKKTSSIVVTSCKPGWQVQHKDYLDINSTP